MSFKAIWLVIVLFVCLNSKHTEAYYEHLDITSEEDLELESQLKLLNKPPITTFQTKEGDIIDCVDINKQPALDHPLLKDHKVQYQPSKSYLKVSFQSQRNSVISNTIRQSCLVGTVPIRRTLKKDLIRLRSLSSKQTTTFDMKDDTSTGAIKFPYDKNVVSLSLKKDIGYYGINGYVSIYNLSVAQDQSSSANVWITGGPSNALNVILAGWQVNPGISGDGLTRLFVYWTADGGAKTGCYNMLCQGFVQVHQTITPDFPISPSSIYQGQQNDYLFIIYQDPKTGNWWLELTEKRIAIGYWPKELFEYLKVGAEQVGWGGIAKPSPNGISPPLGNSHVPNKVNYDEACYFRNINYITNNLQDKSVNYENTIRYVSSTNCYGLSNSQDCGNQQLRYCFTFGGPGGSNCAGT